MNQKITGIQRSYDKGTLRDGVIVIIERNGEIVEYLISGTEWSFRCAEQNFDVSGVLLTKNQIQKINHLLNPSKELINN